MGLERSYEKLVEGFEIKHIVDGLEATHVLAPNQRTCVVYETTSDGHITIELPPLDMPGVRGHIYNIHLTTRATSNVLVVDSNALATLWTLDATGESIACYSDGLRWIELAGTNT